MRAIWFRLLLPVMLALPGPLHAQESEERIEHLYILSFNSWGELLSPGERDLAMHQLGQDRSIERVIIFSYGWGHDADASYADYRQIMSEIDKNLPQQRARPNVAVIGIGWDSSQTGFRKMLNAIIPLPGLANSVAWPLDQALFPISFWSKAAQADRIGFEGLRIALNDIFSVYEDGGPHPEVYLIGHSFGTRIISGLMKNSVGPVDVSSNAFRSAPHVRGTLLFQPALVGANLDLDAEYPVLVTMSENDHAVGFLYPVANIPMNAIGFTLFEALVQRLLLDPVRTGIEATGDTLSDVATAPLPRTPGAEADSDSDSGEPPSLMQSTVKKSWRTLGEVLALPLNLVFTAAFLPIDYVYIQGKGLWAHPGNHMMDTLAQLPVIEIPVDAIGRWTDRDVPWGRRSKGFFTLGSIHEGMGRMSPPLAFYEDPKIYTTAELNELDHLPNGVFVVDATDRIHTGAFGEDLSKPLVNYTLGWIDPIAAHSDFTNPRALELAAWMSSGGRSPLSEPATTGSE